MHAHMQLTVEISIIHAYVHVDIGIYVSDVHTIAVIKAQENYVYIEEGFRDIIEKVNYYIKQPKITICDAEYKLNFALCADYKV